MALLGIDRRTFRHARRRFGAAVSAVLGAPVLRMLGRSWHYEMLDGHYLDDVNSRRGFLAAQWHGRLLLGLHRYRNHDWHVLVSHSGDGSIMARLLRHFGYGVVRGSRGKRSKGGARALREMKEILDDGNVIVITPDGPRGPRHSISPGIAWLARETGHAILPAGLVADRAWSLSSWDRFTIPKPWARVVISLGEPVTLAPGADAAELERASELVRERMLAAESRAFRHLGLEPDW